MKQIKIGKFEVLSGKVIVSDPCYELDTWCQVSLEKLRKGTWAVYVVEVDGRVGELLAFAGVAPSPAKSPTWENVPGEVGVDSGQAGIFDAKHYRDDAVVKSVARLGGGSICEDEPWYSICCDRTFNAKHSAGVIPYGCVSSSGYGDGGYRCYTQRDGAGYVIGVKIVFISAEAAEV